VGPVDEIKKRLWRLDSGLNELTVRWQHLTTLPGQPWFQKPDPFASDSLLPWAVSDAGGCPDPHHRCRSGQYTILLDVTDTLNNHYYDTQQVWFDNKPMISDVHVFFQGIQGLADCTDLHLRPGAPFIPPGAPCNLPWFVNLLGIAYDEYIDEIVPGRAFDVLTALDMRVFDAVCSGSIPASENYSIPPGFALPRNTCCGYTFQLYAQDKTWGDGWAGALHHAWSHPWAVCICNDLPQIDNQPG